MRACPAQLFSLTLSATNPFLFSHDPGQLVSSSPDHKHGGGVKRILDDYPLLDYQGREAEAASKAAFLHLWVKTPLGLNNPFTGDHLRSENTAIMICNSGRIS